MEHSDHYFVECSEKEPTQALLGRILWMLAGPIVLIALTMLNVIRGAGWMTFEDWFFFATMAVMIWGRWLEIRTGCGRTLACSPATRADFRRYVSLFVPGALLIWATSNVVGNHLLHLL